jgi:hypothetical protein
LSLPEHLGFAAVSYGDLNGPTQDLFEHHLCFQPAPTADHPAQKCDPADYLRQSLDSHHDFHGYQTVHRFDLKWHLHESQQRSLVLLPQQQRLLPRCYLKILKLPYQMLFSQSQRDSLRQLLQHHSHLKLSENLEPDLESADFQNDPQQLLTLFQTCHQQKFFRQLLLKDYRMASRVDSCERLHSGLALMELQVLHSVQVDSVQVLH